jgi:SNF2 family DNA or RNA helicase
MARPYVLRREKRDVLADLPPVLRRHEVLDLTDEQRAAYRAAISAGRAGRAGENTYLALFNELRMICDIEPASGSSSKLDRIQELLEEVRDRGEKAIVFSYTLEPLRALERRIANVGLGGQLFTGELDLAERRATLQRFRSDHEVTVLLASSRLASEGLTLVEANNVLFVNRWWNPSSNQQAEDRVVRVGQELPVSVHSFTCRHTVEALLDKILVEKGLTFEALVTRLTTSAGDLDELFEDDAHTS